MIDELEKWLESIWEENPKPEKIMTGQFWTVFSPKSDETERGTIILILREDEDRFLVVPVHHQRTVRRGIDVVLKQEQLNFDDELVVMSDCATWITNNVFERARFVGTVKLEGLNDVLEGIAKQHKIATNLSRVQYLEMIGEDTKAASQKAFRLGVMSLVPLKGNYKEFDKIFDRLYQNLLIASVKPQSFKKTLHKKNEVNEVINLTESISKIQQLNEWYKHLPIAERSNYLDNFKSEKIELLVPVLLTIAKIIVEAAITSDEYKQAYDILHNIIQFDSENHEMAQLYIQTAMLGGGGNKLPMKENIPSVKMLLDADRIDAIVEPDLEPQNWDLRELEKMMDNNKIDQV